MSALPDSMRCVIAKEKGGPEVLTVETRPVPKPRAGEVLLKVDYAGVSRWPRNFSEILASLLPALQWGRTLA